MIKPPIHTYTIYIYLHLSTLSYDILLYALIILCLSMEAFKIGNLKREKKALGCVLECFGATIGNRIELFAPGIFYGLSMSIICFQRVSVWDEMVELKCVFQEPCQRPQLLDFRTLNSTGHFEAQLESEVGIYLCMASASGKTNLKCFLNMFFSPLCMASVQPRITHTSPDSSMSMKQMISYIWSWSAWRFGEKSRKTTRRH